MGFQKDCGNWVPFLFWLSLFLFCRGEEIHGRQREFLVLNRAEFLYREQTAQGENQIVHNLVVG